MNYILRKNKLNPEDLETVLQSDLSKGAKLLYTYLFQQRSGEIINNQVLLKKNVAVSRAMIGNYKRELKSKGLLHENKDMSTNLRFMYLGSLMVAADVFAEDWKYQTIEEDDD